MKVGESNNVGESNPDIDAFVVAFIGISSRPFHSISYP